MWLKNRMQSLGRKEVGHIQGKASVVTRREKAVFGAEDVKNMGD